jgi:hypothetical protein
MQTNKILPRTDSIIFASVRQAEECSVEARKLGTKVTNSSRKVRDYRDFAGIYRVNRTPFRGK